MLVGDEWSGVGREENECYMFHTSGMVAFSVNGRRRQGALAGAELIQSFGDPVW